MARAVPETQSPTDVDEEITEAALVDMIMRYCIQKSVESCRLRIGMASAISETQSPTDVDGEITEPARVDMPHSPRADAPLHVRFGGGTMCDWLEKLVERCKRLRIGSESAIEFVLLVGIGFWTSSNANPAGPSWPMFFVECAKLAGFTCTLGGYGLRNFNPSLSRAMIKAGAVATVSGIIMMLATPLPPVVALIVGLVTWIIVATTVLLD